MASIPSILLSDHENKALFKRVGRMVLSKATAVVQLYVGIEGSWSKFRTGVVCLAKDYKLRSYYIRLYDLTTTDSLVFEQEVYEQFTYKKDCSFFHSFPGDEFMIGLNFADEDEASRFYSAVTLKIQDIVMITAMKVSTEGHSSIPEMNSAPLHQVDVNQQHPFSDSRTKAKLKKPPGRISKSDISAPVDFRHLVHIGHDPETGFNSSYITPEWMQLLKIVGVTEHEIKDKETASFIYDFVENHGGIEAADEEIKAKSVKRKIPPPKPSREGLPPPPPIPPNKERAKRVYRQRRPPPPPPPRMPPPPPPPLLPSGISYPPPPPPPPPPLSSSSISPPPPPPPPPPQLPSGISYPPPPPPPPPPLSSSGISFPPPPPPPPPLQAGTPSSLVQSKYGSSTPPLKTDTPAVSDARAKLLDGIRKGIILKRLATPSKLPPPQDDSLVGALARALAQRKRQLNTPTDSDTDATSSADWSDD